MSVNRIGKKHEQRQSLYEPRGPPSTLFIVCLYRLEALLPHRHDTPIDRPYLTERRWNMHRPDVAAGTHSLRGPSPVQAHL